MNRNLQELAGPRLFCLHSSCEIVVIPTIMACHDSSDDR